MVVITGASNGVGKYLFEYYKSKGISVIGTYNSTKSDPSELTKVDVSDFNQVSTWINKNINSLELITLINCAGISYNSFAHKADPTEWKRVIEVNLFGTFNLIRCLLPIMRNQKYGRIINISSVVAQKPTAGVSAYAASKSALWGLTKSISAEVGDSDITINTINLGYVSIGMGIEKVPENYQEIIKNQIPSGKFCDPKDVVQTIEYLINTSYINGASIDINGGLI